MARKMTRIEALEFAVQRLEADAGASEPGYSEECYQAIDVLEGMLASLKWKSDRERMSREVTNATSIRE